LRHWTPIEAPDLQYLDSSTATWLDIWGWTPEAAATQPEWKLPDPSIFIVGTDGRIEAGAKCPAGKK